ncbi:hypothetical protein RND81_13G181500 [Saponaria officinalis]
MLRLTRLNLNHQHRRQTTANHRPSSLQHVIQPVFSIPLMADASEKTENQTSPPPPPATVADGEREKSGKVPPPLPTPPEKPEAGDCCGSGCVRCVWDIYYDELESYNQLLQEYNNSIKHS